MVGADGMVRTDAEDVLGPREALGLLDRHRQFLGPQGHLVRLCRDLRGHQAIHQLFLDHQAHRESQLRGLQAGILRCQVHQVHLGLRAIVS